MMHAQITKSPPITALSRKYVTISPDLHYLVMVEAAKRRLKVKDIMNHFVIQGLSGLGVDVSGVLVEEEQTETKEVA